MAEAAGQRRTDAARAGQLEDESSGLKRHVGRTGLLSTSPPTGCGCPGGGSRS